MPKATQTYHQSGYKQDSLDQYNVTPSENQVRRKKKSSSKHPRCATDKNAPYPNRFCRGIRSDGSPCFSLEGCPHLHHESTNPNERVASGGVKLGLSHPVSHWNNPRLRDQEQYSDNTPSSSRPSPYSVTHHIDQAYALPEDYSLDSRRHRSDRESARSQEPTTDRTRGLSRSPPTERRKSGRRDVSPVPQPPRSRERSSRDKSSKDRGRSSSKYAYEPEYSSKHKPRSPSRARPRSPSKYRSRDARPRSPSKHRSRNNRPRSQSPSKHRSSSSKQKSSSSSSSTCKACGQEVPPEKRSSSFSDRRSGRRSSDLEKERSNDRSYETTTPRGSANGSTEPGVLSRFMSAFRPRRVRATNQH
ncbi:hypothetical protein BDV98DRAFT_429609 [Pterulicium gracile]|uniref:Uncharacterized protein n=1 Tax=Pterulicium gracile TaxID=1884261 RepID=A0A5C3QVX3_9AGAR|nr:hypothetical protein BDV98DRAFT_429609 [Pterula gracilis]